jgi:hypothetical protein
MMPHRQEESIPSLAADGGWCKHLVPPRLKPGVSRTDAMKTLFTLAAVCMVLLAALGNLPKAQTGHSGNLAFEVFARPLGLWCDGTPRLTVGISNTGRNRIVVGVPERSDTRFPYTSNGYISFKGGVGSGWGGGCGCSEGFDCELCATPDARVPLGPGEELTWTMDLSKSEIVVGPAQLQLTLNWYGGIGEETAALQKMSGTTSRELSVTRVDARCFVATILPKKAG